MTTPSSPLAGKRIWVAGHQGMLGRALVERFERSGAELICASRQELDLTDRSAVSRFLDSRRPQAAIVAAARVGGVAAYAEAPATYFSENLAIASNCILESHRCGVDKLVYVASAAAYPEHAPQPLQPSALMSGALDPSHEAYGLAKIAGITMCRFHRQQYGANFVSVMPTNLYGSGGHSDETRGHVIPTLIRRFHEAKQAGESEIRIWGTGKARRQFLHVDDCADAVIVALSDYDGVEPLNIAGDEEVTIGDLAAAIAQITGFAGKIAFDPSRPEGAARRALDWSRLASLGWKPRIVLKEGLAAIYDAGVFQQETENYSS